jgi:hypothetical protein
LIIRDLQLLLHAVFHLLPHLRKVRRSAPGTSRPARTTTTTTTTAGIRLTKAQRRESRDNEECGKGASQHDNSFQKGCWY